MRKLPANRENDVHDLLSKPNIQLLMQKFDCQIKDIKHQGESLPFEQVYRFRQQVQNNYPLKCKIHFSFFKGGIVQITPYKNISIAQIHQLIIGDYLQQSTKILKELYQKSLETGDKKAFDLQK